MELAANEYCESVTTHDLREGDLVINYGMRLRLSERGERQDNGSGGHVVWFRGTVENREEMTDTDGRAVGVLKGLLRTTGPDAYTWTVQGNRLATWSRVRTTAIGPNKCASLPGTHTPDCCPL